MTITSTDSRLNGNIMFIACGLRTQQIIDIIILLYHYDKVTVVLFVRQAGYPQVNGRRNTRMACTFTRWEQLGFG